MPNVALAAGTGTDPIGEQALVAAFSTSLPEYDVVPVRAPWARPAVAYREIGRSAALVLAGESTLTRPGAVRAAAALLPLASATHTPLTFMGVGAGPLDRAADRWLSRWLVRRADLFLLADEESSQALAGTGAPTPLRIAADPAWASLPAPTRGHGAGGGSQETVVAVIDGSCTPGQVARLRHTLEVLASHGLRLRLQPWASAGTSGLLDQVLARHLADDLDAPVDIARPPRDLEDACELLSDAAVVMTQRYRAIQAAAASGVPVVPIADHPQMAALARRLHQPSAAGVLDPSSVAAIVREAIHGPGPSPAAVKEETSRAEAGFALLRLVVERGCSDPSAVERLPLRPEPWL